MRPHLPLRITALLAALTVGGLAFAVISVTPSPPPAPAVGQPYSVALLGAGGDAPYTFVATDGHLPAGIDLSADGTLSGSATSLSSVNYTIVAADAEGREATVIASSASTVAAVLTSSTGTSVYGEPVTFTATISGASPSGSVQFCADGSPSDATFCASGIPLCGAGSTLSSVNPASSVATCAVTTLSIGAHTINAHYGGDANNAEPPVTNIASLTVSKAATTTTMNSPASTQINQAISVSASVPVSAPGSGTPTGSITVDDGTESCVIVLPATSCLLTPTTSGNKTLTASYSGDANFLVSAATAPLAVGLLPSTVVLISSLNPSKPGQLVTFTATVTETAAPGSSAKALVAAVPTGSVTFTTGATTLGTVPLNAGGQAATSTSALSAGPHTITATYSGDATTATSSASLVQQVNAEPVVPAWTGSREGLALLTLLLLSIGVFFRWRTPLK